VLEDNFEEHFLDEKDRPIHRGKLHFHLSILTLVMEED